MTYYEHNLNVKILFSHYSELNQSWAMKNTIDPFIRLYYIADGNGKVICPQNNFVLEKGKFYLLPSNTPLTFWTQSSLNIYWIHAQLTVTPGIDVFYIIPGKIMCIPQPDLCIIDRFQKLIATKTLSLADELESQELLMKIFAT